MSFKAKLSTFLLVIILLPAMFLYLQYDIYTNAVREQLQSKLQSNANAMAALVSEHLLQRQRDIRALAITMPDVNYIWPFPRQQQQSISSHLNQLLPLYSEFSRIILLSPEGRLLAANDSNAQGDELGILAVDALHVESSQWFQAAKNSLVNNDGLAVMSSPSTSLLANSTQVYSKQLDILFAVPMQNSDGRLVAVLIGLMDFAVMANRLNTYKQTLSHNGYGNLNVRLMNNGNTVLLDLSHVNSSQSSTNDSWRELDREQNSINQAAYITKSSLVAISDANAGNHWRLDIGHPLLVASAKFSNMLWLLLAVIAIMLFTGRLLCRNLTFNIHLLSDAVASLSDLEKQPLAELKSNKVTKEVKQVLDELEQLRHQLTQQQQLEQKNQQHRDELLLKTAAIEAATTGILLADATQDTTPIIYANQSFYRTTGYSQQEVIGRHCLFLHGDDNDQPGITQLQTALRKGESADVILRNYRKNGQMFWNRLYISPVKNTDNEVTHFIGIETDVTTLKSYEKKIRELNLHLEQRVQSRTMELQQAESQLRATFDTMTDALVVVDESAIIQDANRTTTSIFGYDADELIGLDLAILLAKADKVDDVEIWVSSLLMGTTKKLGALAESSGITKMGKVFPIELSVTSMRIADKREYTVVIRDISERKANEVRLKNARDEAEQANRIKSEFLGNMSHELRTPMNAVIGMTDLVLESQLNREQRHQLTIVSQSAHALLSLLNQILDLTKLERGSMEIETLVFELRPIIQSALSMVELQAKNKGLNMVVEVSSVVSELLVGDPERLRQVLINLIGNAVKFTETGDVTVRVMTESGKDDYLHFVVEDTGIGIEHNRIEQIFRPFVQSDGSISRRYGGTGLGTTISKQLVEKMGGEIWVESELDQGSKFHFTLFLPAADEDAVCEYQNQHQSMHYQSLRPLKILLAEDVNANAELIKTRLGRDGHQIEWAEDGAQAVELYEQSQGQFDLVFMDIHMPNMNGYQAAEAIQRYNQQQDIETPIIALTASGMGKDMVRCQQVGMQGFVIKPVDFTLLRSEMAKLLPQDFKLVPSSSIITEVVREDEPRTNSPLDKVKDCIDIEKAVNNWGDEALYTKMLRQFPAQWAQCCYELAQHVQKTELEAAHSLVHKLRGVSGGLGMTAVFNAVKELETAIKANEPEAKILGLNSELDDELKTVIKSIDAMPIGDRQQMLNEALVVSLSVEDLTEKMLALREMLSRGMTDDELLEHLTSGLRGMIDENELTLLITAVDEFSFEGAISILDRIVMGLGETTEGMHG